MQYTKILSPYDGVVIFRGESVHPGTFIRSAAEGTSVPLLTVARDDKMRTIVLVPDRDVPYCKVGDPATVAFDPFAGQSFQGQGQPDRRIGRPERPHHARRDRHR